MTNTSAFFTAIILLLSVSAASAEIDFLPRLGETSAEYEARQAHQPTPIPTPAVAECQYGRNTIVGGCNSPPPDYWYEYHYNYRYTYPSRRRECTPLTRGCPL